MCTIIVACSSQRQVDFAVEEAAADTGAQRSAKSSGMVCSVKDEATAVGRQRPCEHKS